MKLKFKTVGAAAGLTLLVILAGCSKTPTKAQLEKGGELCQNFIASEMKSTAAFSKNIETTIYDSWLKDGKVVFEVGYREQYGAKSSYSVRLCVYDEAAGTLTSPSPLNSSEWKK